MIPIARAIEAVLSAVRPRPAHEVPLSCSLGRALAEDVRSSFAIPPFANSQMDGFAVRAADLVGASARQPVRLHVAGTIAAGAPGGSLVSPGRAVRIMTGAPLPAGADAVVRAEDTAAEGDAVAIQVAPAPGDFVRLAGEDVGAGELVLERGRALRPADIGLLAAMGRPTVRVASRPRVAVLATGDELVAHGTPLGPGQIYNSNAYALEAAVAEAGGEAVRLAVAGDQRDALREAFRAAAEFDVVVSTGGVSVGDFDYVKQIMDDIGLERRFWRVAQKPGQPITFAEREGWLFFGLPGNPVSSLVCFTLYVAPALRRSLGLRAIFAPTIRVRMAEAVRTSRDLEELVRCTLEPGDDGSPSARPTGSQSSGVLRSLCLADCLVLSPPGTSELRRGEVCRALLLTALPGLAERHPFG